MVEMIDGGPARVLGGKDLKTWVNDDAAKDETWLGISICAADNRKDDVSMDEEISAVEDGVAAMAEKIERGCSRKEIARTMTAAGLESFQRTKFRVRHDSFSKTRRHRIFLIKICEIISTKEINDPTTTTATLHLFFHDCMVEGYDASVLISSNSFNTA